MHSMTRLRRALNHSLEPETCPGFGSGCVSVAHDSILQAVRRVMREGRGARRGDDRKDLYANGGQLIP